MNLHTECLKCGASLNTKIKKASYHSVSVKCVFCGDISEYEIDKENGVEKKLNNYQLIIAKNQKKIKNQAEEITRLQNALNMANVTVAGLMKELEDYKRIITAKNENFVNEIGKVEKRYESQLKVQDTELNKRLIIINFLKDELYKRVANDNIR